MQTRVALRERLFTPSRGLIAVVLVAVCLLVHARGLTNGFVNYDDARFVTNNPVVQEGITWRGVVWAFTTDAELYFIPLSWLTHMLDCQVYGLRPWGHHLTSIMLHALNTLLLFLVLARMTGNMRPAALTALLFAVHPLHVESVAWTSERKDVLSALFWIAAMGAYFNYARAPNVRRYLGVVILVTLGLMAKPMVMTLPWIFLLLDYWPLNRVLDPRQGVSPAPRIEFGPLFWRCVRLTIEKVPLFALAIADCVYSFVTLKGGVDFGEQRPFGARLIHAVVAYAGYLVKTVWPADMAPYYPYPLGLPPLWQIVGAALLLTAITAAALFLWRRCPYLLTGWAWYLAALLPVIGLLQPRWLSFSDRYTYLPLIGVFMMAAWGLEDVLAAIAAKVPSPNRSRFHRSILFGAVAAALFGLSIQSIIQIGYWHDSLALFGHALRATGDNAVALHGYALALDDSGQKTEALTYYEKAALDDRYRNSALHNKMASVYTDLGRIDDAIAQYKRMIEIDPSRAEAHNNLAVLLDKRWRFKEALDHYEQAVWFDPQSVSAHINYGGALTRMGKMQEAMDQFQQAVRLDPADFKAHYNLATALASSGKIDEAASEYLRVIELAPDNVDAYINLGVAKCIQKKFDEALVFYGKALERDPRNTKALDDVAKIRRTLQQQTPPNTGIEHYQALIAENPTEDQPRLDLARLLVSMRRLDEAAQQYREIIKNHPGNADAYFNLGALSNAQGRPDEAAACFKKALEINPNDAAARQALDKIAPAQTPSSN